MWKGFNHQPLIHKLDAKHTIWSGYDNIVRVVGHVDLEKYMDAFMEISHTDLERYMENAIALEHKPYIEAREREEAIKKLKGILEEATEADDSVCYVTSDDADALKVAIKALEQEPCWVPVSERLPKAQTSGADDDYSDWVQVTLHVGEDNDVVCRAYYCFSDKHWYTDTLVLGEVTAWQPLSEPYKISECREKEDRTEQER